MLLPYPLYNPRHPHSNHCTHALILAHYETFFTSAMHLIGLVMSFSICLDPPLITRSKTMILFSLLNSTSLLLPLYHTHLSPSSIFLSCTLSIYLYPQIIASTHLDISFPLSPITLSSLSPHSSLSSRFHYLSPFSPIYIVGNK